MTEYEAFRKMEKIGQIYANKNIYEGSSADIIKSYKRMPNGLDNKKRDLDIGWIDGRISKIEEKTASYVHSEIPIEIIQDIKKDFFGYPDKSEGWRYSKKGNLYKRLNNNDIVNLIKESYNYIDEEDLGWYFSSEADYILYMYFGLKTVYDIDKNSKPKVIYFVDKEKLTKFLLDDKDHNLNTVCTVNNKGHGKTLNIHIEWNDLINENVVQVIKSINNSDIKKIRKRLLKKKLK